MTREEREEAAKILKLEQSSWSKNPNLKVDQRLHDAYNVAIKALQEESVLDKIRDKIEAHPKTYPFVNHFDAYIKASDCLQIIDNYRTESEKV